MSNCENCAKKPDAVPFVVHEADMARMERTVKRLWILLLVLVFLFVGSNAAWIWYDSQFVSESTEVEQEIDTGDGDAFVVGVGDLNYGEDQTEGEENEPNP